MPSLGLPAVETGVSGYSPQLVRSLSETSQTSSQGAGGGPAGNGGGGGGGGGGGSNPFLPAYNPFPTSGSQIAGNFQNVAEAAGAGLAALGANWGISSVVAALTAGEVVIPVVGWIAAVGTGLFELFDELFGGGSEPPPPRQLVHARHPLYPVILGFPEGLIPTEASEGKPQLCGDAEFCGTKPLQKDPPAPGPTAQHFWQKPGCGSALGELGIGAVGTALTLGPIAAAPYLAPELFEGLEGLEAFAKMGIVAVPGPILMEQGAVGVWQKCF